MFESCDMSDWDTPLSQASALSSIAINDEACLSIMLQVQQEESRELWSVKFQHASSYLVSKDQLEPLPAQRFLQRLEIAAIEAGGTNHFRIITDTVSIDVLSDARPEFHRIGVSQKKRI